MPDNNQPSGTGVVVSALTGNSYDTSADGIPSAIEESEHDAKLWELQLLQEAAEEAAANQPPRTDPNDPFPYDTPLS